MVDAGLFVGGGASTGEPERQAERAKKTSKEMNEFWFFIFQVFNLRLTDLEPVKLGKTTFGLCLRGD